MPTVNVAVLGSVSRGYAVIIRPWQVTVSSLPGDPIWKRQIEWESTHRLKIEFDNKTHFKNYKPHASGDRNPKSGPISYQNKKSRGKIFHYTVRIDMGAGKWIIIDPDYKVTP